MKYELDKNSGLIKVQTLYLIRLSVDRSSDPSYSLISSVHQSYMLWMYTVCAFIRRFEKKNKSDHSLLSFLSRLIVFCTHPLCTHTTTASFPEPFVRTVTLLMSWYSCRCFLSPFLSVNCS